MHTWTCMYVCMYVRTQYVPTQYVCMYVCTYPVCMYVCMYVYRAAIEEGKMIYYNIRNFVRFQLST